MPRPTATPSKPKAPRKPRENKWAYLDWGKTDHVTIMPLGSRHANAKECRALAAWLLRAADWLDAQRGAK
jgi:hypothetical protein